MKKEHLKNLGKWNAVGSKENKKLFISLLRKNGFKAFDGKRTAKKVLYDGAVIKHVDINRRSEVGNYFLSSSEIDKDVMIFDLDKLDVFWCLTFILQPKY